MGLGNSLKKLTKHSDFTRFLRVEMVPYRQVHPDAPVGEWRAKRQQQQQEAAATEDEEDVKEKMVRELSACSLFGSV